MTPLTILYATDDMTSRLTAAHDARDWDVFCPSSINESLALSVYCAPHAIVIDGDSEWLNELTLHLMAVTGPSARLHDIVVRLADTPLAVDVPRFITYHELPSDIAPDELAHLLAELNTQRLPNDQAALRRGAA
jgi:hypothetical protein